ncbi:hypothetical protein C8R48DRAFT_52347 [Suillus tomentosus]|nr:hypothetical protein C8R48DRAFT_52347 [Suillus tomentosus]
MIPVNWLMIVSLHGKLLIGVLTIALEPSGTRALVHTKSGIKFRHHQSTTQISHDSETVGYQIQDLIGPVKIIESESMIESDKGCRTLSMMSGLRIRDAISGWSKQGLVGCLVQKL